MTACFLFIRKAIRQVDNSTIRFCSRAYRSKAPQRTPGALQHIDTSCVASHFVNQAVCTEGGRGLGVLSSCENRNTAKKTCDQNLDNAIARTARDLIAPACHELLCLHQSGPTDPLGGGGGEPVHMAVSQGCC